jgi:formylglycine-generating enzyme required for sulfatase activity
MKSIIHDTANEPFSACSIRAVRKGRISATRTSGRTGKAVFLLGGVLVALSLLQTGCSGGGDRQETAGSTKTITLPGGATMEMVWCPPGTFMMGSPEDAEFHYDDETQHQVTLTKGFWMAKTEVTQAQWKSVMGNNPSDHEGDDLPVECVAWDDVQQFCAKTGLQLPTEAQWEYACRAGTTGDYAGTGNLDDMGWYAGDETHPVGTKEPNEWGLYDMHGNVWEWCQDWYGDYPNHAVTDPTGPGSGSKRVNRGGSWDYNARFCRSASRDNASPDGRYDALGFRPVMNLSAD